MKTSSTDSFDKIDLRIRCDCNLAHQKYKAGEAEKAQCLLVEGQDEGDLDNDVKIGESSHSGRPFAGEKKK